MLPYACQSLESHVVPFNGFDVPFPSKPSVPIHDERNVLWHGALLNGADEELSQLSDRPCKGRE